MSCFPRHLFRRRIVRPCSGIYNDGSRERISTTGQQPNESADFLENPNHRGRGRFHAELPWEPHKEIRQELLGESNFVHSHAEGPTGYVGYVPQAGIGTAPRKLKGISQLGLTGRR